MTNLPCEIVRDLLPSYADGLTDPVTNTAVEDHLEGCAACKGVYERMTGGEAKADPVQEKELNFLKKKRKQTLWIVLGSLLSAFFLLLAGLFVGFFLVEREVSPEALVYTVKADDDNLYFHGYTVDSGTAITRTVKDYENGVLTFRVKGVLVGVFRDNGFSETVPLDKDLREVRLGDRLIWKDGVFIEPTVSALYNTRHGYVGSMPDNRQTLTVLGVEDLFGSCDHELQTDAAPYGWTLRFAEPIELENLQRARETLRADAILMMAVIDNLDTVCFEFTSHGEVVSVTQSITVTREEAEQDVGMSLREAGADPVLLQGLFYELKNRDAFYTITTETLRSDAVASVTVINDTDLEIREMGMEFYVDGALKSEQWGMNANETSIEKGEAMYFDVQAQELGVTADASGAALSGVVTYRFKCTVPGDLFELPERELTLHPRNEILFLQQTEDGTLILTPVVGN